MPKKFKVFYKEKTICFKYNKSENKQNINSNDIEALFSNPLDEIIFLTPSPEKLFFQFSSYFTVIEAAGGIVVNQNYEWLMIYRLGYWDLPKGKIDNGENAIDTAIREIFEECNVSVSKENALFLNVTYHIYEQNNKRILKRTYWYMFFTNKNQQLKPQSSENIEKVEWINKEKWFEIKNKTYLSIAHLIEEVFF